MSRSRTHKRPGSVGAHSDEPAHAEAYCVRRRDGSLLLSTLHEYAERSWNLLQGLVLDKNGERRPDAFLRQKYEVVPVDIDEVDEGDDDDLPLAAE